MNRTDWKQTRLGSELELLYGRGLPASARVAGDVPVYGSNGVVGLHNKSLVEGPGIIVGRKGSVGEVAFSDGPFWPIDTTYYVANRGGNNWHFVYFLLQHLQLTGLNSHSTVPGLNRESVYSIEWAFPPKSEQEKIAAVLWKIQKTMEIEDAIVRNAHDLKKSLLRRLFTHGLRGEPLKETEIGPVPESWDVTSFEKVLPVAQYGLSVRGESQGRYPILRMNCQEDGQVRFANLQFVDLDDKTFGAYELRDGDLLFNRTNSFELVGRTAIFHSDKPAVFASYLIRLRVDAEQMIPDFVNYYLNMESTQQALKLLATRAVSQSNVSASKLKTFQIPKPEKSEQREIADILQTVDRKIDIHESKKRSLQDLFKTTLHKLMTAQIRVNDLDIESSEVEGA